MAISSSGDAPSGVMLSFLADSDGLVPAEIMSVGLLFEDRPVEVDDDDEEEDKGPPDLSLLMFFLASSSSSSSSG